MWFLAFCLGRGFGSFPLRFARVEVDEEPVGLLDSFALTVVVVRGVSCHSLYRSSNCAFQPSGTEGGGGPGGGANDIDTRRRMG